MKSDGLRNCAVAMLFLAVLANGCGRSGLTGEEESYLDADAGSWSGGSWQTSYGGGMGNEGGISPGGAGWVASGGASLGGATWINSGGTSWGGAAIWQAGGSVGSQSCCTAHSSPGCSDASVAACVCRTNPQCCSILWSTLCARLVNSTGCGYCPSSSAGGASGASGAGGTAGHSSGGVAAFAGAAGHGGMTAVGGSGWSGYTAAGGVWGGGTGSGGIASGSGGNGVGAAAGASSAGGAAPQISLIDDMEDGVGDILPVEGRRGYWYTFNDSSPGGEQLPVSNGLLFEMTPISNRPNSSFAAATWGEGFVLWGAGMGLILNDRVAARQFYNGRQYSGIAFWARADDGSSNVLRFNVSDRNTVPEGGVCGDCWDHFGATVVLSSSWHWFLFSWDQLHQRGWGSPLLDAIDTTALRSLEFSVPEGVAFSFYVDDVAFYR